MSNNKLIYEICDSFLFIAHSNEQTIIPLIHITAIITADDFKKIEIYNTNKEATITIRGYNTIKKLDADLKKSLKGVFK